MNKAIAELAGLDWDSSEWPEGFQPIDAVVLVKGVYQTDEGSLTRPVWCHRWTVPLGRNVAERIGAYHVAHEMATAEALSAYGWDDDDD